MSQDKNLRIARNTGMLYFRSLFCLLLSLYSSRLFLQALGVEDFGIYNAVGGLASMFWMVSSALSSAVGRFLNYELGRQDSEGFKEVFSLSVNIMTILAILAAVLAESLGMWFITSKMTIPVERLEVAKLIFHLSVVTMVVGFLIIPFNSAIVAHERMGFIAIVNMAEAVLKLGVAVFLTFSVKTGDKLALYAILLAVITILVSLSNALFAYFSFAECRIRLIFRAKRIGEMFRFAFWNFIASITGTFSGQGVNMALNVYQGPVLNTARGLTTTVSNAVSLLVYNFTLSTSPQITQSFAAGDIKRCRNLVFRGTRFSAFLMLLIVIPLCLETNFVLRVWLGSFPDHTVRFVRISLVYAFISVLMYLFNTAKQATGDIRYFQLTFCLLNFIDFVVAWLFLSLGWQVEWIYVGPLMLLFIKVTVAMLFVKGVLHYSLLDIMREILLPIILVASFSAFLPFLLYFIMPQGWIRFFVVLGVSLLSTTTISYFIGCDKEERRILKDYAFSFVFRNKVRVSKSESMK